MTNAKTMLTTRMGTGMKMAMAWKRYYVTINNTLIGRLAGRDWAGLIYDAHHNNHNHNHQT
jgi:hypothetical protein